STALAARSGALAEGRQGREKSARSVGGEMRSALRSLTGLSAVAFACAHALTPEQEAAVKRGDCSELLRAADVARAQELFTVAEELAKGCAQGRLTALVSTATPADALLWCGRAKAARAEAFRGPATVGQAAAQLHPKLTVGPPDPDSPIEPSLAAALKQIGPDYNLGWDADDPDVIVGRLGIYIEHATNTSTAVVTDAKGAKQ